MTSKKNQYTTVTCLIFTFICLASMLSEYIILQCEQFIYQKEYHKFSITEHIGHWSLICFVWGIVIAVLFYIALRVYNFNLTQRTNKPSAIGCVVAACLLYISSSAKFFLLNGWKIVLDFTSSGWFLFIFQYVYYLFEVLLIVLVIIFSQEAGKRVFGTDKIPWGGILLALTWGLSHIITQGDIYIGLIYTALSVLFGVAYTAVNKNIYIFYPLAILMFLI